jgi:hypothetical protein
MAQLAYEEQKDPQLVYRFQRAAEP